jgi:release factor glutamine methyltransferase
LKSAATFREVLVGAREALRRAGIEEAELEARLLVADAAGTDAVGLLTRSDETLGEDALARLATHVQRRLAHEPVGRILGMREFWGLPFRLAPETLEPRPDTETVVDAALAGVADRSAPMRILDLGTGSGCILVALLHELPRATGIGIDRSSAAVRTARANAEANHVGGRAAFLCGDWAQAVGGSFHLVVSNPPYIRSDVIPDLAPEVFRHDPAAALDGGGDGLDAYRAILTDLPRLLCAEGTAVIEIGSDQAEDVAAIARGAGLKMRGTRRDLGGQPRAVSLGAMETLA